MEDNYEWSENEKKEWENLIYEAKFLGLTVENVRGFLLGRKVSESFKKDHA